MPSPPRTPGRRPLRRVEETSAGGLVLDTVSAAANAALIARRDKRGRLLWSLPKGHVERDETTEEAAVREVAEETGVTGAVLGPLGTIDFWFVAGEARVHKTVHHFLLLRTSGDLSDDDIEVAEVAWVPLSEVARRLAYADERRLLDGVPTILADAS
ncbi:NUDIX hydrolase [Parafrankia sp. FMc6]|uniref:NUDIX hydrolase n=1 Tax=Parafrankia soli TaxID=2599596 RepID=UPI0034D3E9E6